MSISALNWITVWISMPDCSVRSTGVRTFDLAGVVLSLVPTTGLSKRKMFSFQTNVFHNCRTAIILWWGCVVVMQLYSVVCSIAVRKCMWQRVATFSLERGETHYCWVDIGFCGYFRKEATQSTVIDVICVLHVYEEKKYDGQRSHLNNLLD